MTAATHSERPPQLLPTSSNSWWSPLPQEDALSTLQALGASRSRNVCLLTAKSDVFCPALAFEAVASQKGTLIRVETRMVGFGRDFGRAVQLGLSAFAMLVLLQVVFTADPCRVLRLGTIVALGWSMCMALFALAHALMAKLGRDMDALDRARAKARSALFARHA